MNKIELEERTLRFTVDVIRFLPTLRPAVIREVLGRQLLDSASSIGANYREANRAESRKDFAHKLSVVEKEAAETLYWLDVLVASDHGEPDRVTALRREASEFVRIFSSARTTIARQDRGN